MKINAKKKQHHPIHIGASKISFGLTKNYQKDIAACCK